MKIREKKKGAQGKKQKNKYSLRTRLRGWFHHGRFIGFDIQSIIMAVFTGLTITTTVVMGFLIYNRFKLAIKQTAVSNAESMIESTVDKVDTDLAGIRQISNGVNYNIIQEYDISSQEFSRQFSLLYEVNVDKVQSMALYDNSGKLVAAEPVAVQKDKVNVEEQEWYKNASEDIENMHFSTPHIQDLFQDGANRYYWVISLSRSVDINDGDKPVNGVLLIDMKYSVIEEALSRINDSSSETYYYLCNRDGDIIYHPRRAEIDRGFFTEESTEAAVYDDGTYEIKMTGGKENVVVSSIAYTGWKIIGVVPESVQTASINQYRYYIITTVVILLMMLLWVNRIITKKIYEQIEILMQEIIRQQNERRKSEMDALQSQINPHFLYNTLESITWMVEANRNTDAVFMISELAKLLRISLSKGRTVIRIADEIQHSTSYMNIQKVRYKERFATEFIIDEEINDYCTVKLIVQPILENAIYYGVGNMDEDDGGKITVRGEKKGDDIYISVEDNGMGMSEDIARNILVDNNKVPKHGSGVGVINVHSRIKLMFGSEYGLKVYSEPDEGTKVVIHIPAIPYTEENRERLERQDFGRGMATDEEE